MAGERRTRAEKSRTQLQRQELLTYSFHSDHGVQMTAPGVMAAAKPKSANAKRPQPGLTDLFAYDVHLIYRDLLKTVIITTIILCAVIGLKLGLH